MTLQARYDAMWDAAAPAVRGGRASLDGWLRRRDEDDRRGLTLLARPAADVADRVEALLDRLRALEPEQHYQPRADLHHTVLSLFTATTEHARHLAHAPAYAAAVAEVVAAAPPFAIAVRGVTLSTGAVLAQGFPQDDTLAVLRQRLRAALTARGLGAELDRRYRLETAHLTIVRFAAPLRDPARFVDALAGARTLPLGVSRIDRLELTSGDWYHSAARERPIAAHALTAGG